ncbi:MAG: hypothetical protein ACOVOV_00480 [Dolichospermum sp.]
MYNKFSTLLRIYFYSDANMGWGDAGSFKYVKVSKKDFTKEAKESIFGKTQIVFKPTPELMEKLKSLGYDYFTMGFDFSTEEKYNDELTQLRAKLERLETL